MANEQKLDALCYGHRPATDGPGRQGIVFAPCAPPIARSCVIASKNQRLYMLRRRRRARWSAGRVWDFQEDFVLSSSDLATYELWCFVRKTLQIRMFEQSCGECPNWFIKRLSAYCTLVYECDIDRIIILIIIISLGQIFFMVYCKHITHARTHARARTRVHSHTAVATVQAIAIRWRPTVTACSAGTMLPVAGHSHKHTRWRPDFLEVFDVFRV